MSTILLKHASIIDIRGKQIIENQHLVIEEDRITSITSELPDLDFDQIIDIDGKFLMPGLCDAHVHVKAISANLNNLRFQPLSYVTPVAMQIMEAMLMRGFTTVRDAGGADWGLAKAVEEGYITSPRLIFGGQALSPTGGHGDSRSEGEYTGPYPQGSSITRLCDGITEVRKACRDLIRSGANHIKIMASGGVASPTDRIDSLQFSAEEIQAVVEEAENANIYVLAHTYTAEAVNRALELGVRSIEHANLLDERSITLFSEKNAYLVPTLITYYALKEEGLELGLPQSSYEKIDAVLKNGKQAIRDAYRGGVKMVYGTDLLGEMHRKQLEEFALLSELIDDPWAVLKMATVNAAELVNMVGDIGEIKQDAYADLLVYDQNPVQNLDVLLEPENNLKLIMKAGTVFKNEL